LNHQPDLFPTTAGIDQAPALDPASMEQRARPRLVALLEEARKADTLPWNEERTRINSHLFHNSANWLPAAERDTLRAAFVRELERLGAIEPNVAADEANAAAARRTIQN
jgi:hypothetical protein